MKTYHLTIACLASFLFLGTGYTQVMTSILDGEPHQSEVYDSYNHFKAGGDTIWSTTFDWEDPDSPRGWTLPAGWEIGEVTDFGFNWIWQKDTFKFLSDTRFFAPPSHFKTPEDGFLLMPIQAYNMADGVFTGYDVDAYIITESIDCSDAPSVIVNLSQYFRYCCSNVFLEMAVTNDAGVHWAVYDMTYGIPGNSIVPPKYRAVEINISDVAAGMNDVRIKFQMRNAENYYWFIDDLVLTEAYQIDLALQDYWAEMNGGFTESVGHINYLPMSQIGTESPVSGRIGDYDFIGAVQNVGMEDTYDAHLNVQVLRNGEEVSAVNSETTVLWSLDRDTLAPAEPFFPGDYGDYQINFDAVTDGDLRTDNNLESYNITVNDTLYLRSDQSAEDAANSGGWGGSNQAGDMVGMKYDIYTNTEINSLTAYIASFNADEYPGFQYVLLKYVMEEEAYIEWLVTDIIDMDSTMVRTWVTMEIEKDGETEFLEPGEYVACVRIWGDNGTEIGSQGMWIGRDLSTKSVNKYTYIYLVSNQSEFSPDKLLLIGINLDESGGPTEALVTFNVDMNKHILNGEFNPQSDELDIPGTFNDWEGSASMADDDGDGIYSLTLEGFTIAETIEFKYRINRNWDTSEFPMGGPNRSYQIRYWNDLHHVYNGGETTGVTTIEMDVSTMIYPNPNNGSFMIDIKSGVLQSYNISMVNSIGMLVYNKKIANCLSYNENLVLNLPSGLYFLIIENDLGRTTKKVIIE